MSSFEGERATVVVGIICAGVLLAFYVIFISNAWNFDSLKRNDRSPIAPDFANFWAASKLALSGKPTLVYSPNEIYKIEHQVLGTQHDLPGFYYPPVFLLAVLPLALIPYLTSFIIWIIGTLALYWMVLSRIGRHPIILPLFLSFPGTYDNFFFGQNAYLSGMLLGGGLLLLDRSPLIAGCLLGCLCYKPQFIILILFVLTVGRCWMVLAGAVATSVVLSIASILVFGYDIWVAYFQIMSIPMKLLEGGQTVWSIMPTFFAAALSAGFGVKAAYMVQAAVMLAVASGLAWVWNKKTSTAIRGAVLVLGILLFTPYAFIYELALLALPLCWLWEEGRVKGRLPGELILLFFGWLMPFPGLQGRLQIVPEILLALFVLALVKASSYDAKECGASPG
jgi:alpha-1,2-mannosyltransferase